MKKSLLALAIFGVFAGSANAQSAITIYGVADIGVVFDHANENRTSLSSGIQSGSRIGFKGTEDLGGGLSANFVLENGFNLDAGTMGQGGLLFGRRATVGLAGDFGAVNFGRRNTPYFNAMDSVDPMNVGFAGNATNLFASTGIRMNNAVIYTTPMFSNISAEIAYGFGEVEGSTAASQQIGASIAYVAGPVSIALAHHNANNLTDTVRTKNTVLTGKYNFNNIVTAHLAYADNSGGALDSNDFLIGASVPFGPNTVLFSYIEKNDKSILNNDASQIALAYTYALSKRTNLYASYAKINNDNTAAFKTNSAFGDREGNFGIRHKF